MKNTNPHAGEEQLDRLSTFLKNRVLGVLPRDFELRLAVSRAIDAGLEDYLKDKRLEAYAVVDVEKLVGDFDHYLAVLKNLAEELQALSPRNVKMTVSTHITKPVIVRLGHRVVLREFPVGTVLRRRHLKRADGAIGGVELIWEGF